MYASIRPGHLDAAHLFRHLAAASAAILFLGWSIMFAFEIVSWGEWIPNIHSYDQAIVLAVLFVSYAIGWRHELAGGTLTLIATAAFFAVGYHGVKAFPPLAIIWFAVPGVLYLLAWLCGDRRSTRTNGD